MAILYRYAMLLQGKEKAVLTSDFENYLDAEKITPYARTGIIWAIEHGILFGTYDEKTGKYRIDPQHNTTRAEAAAFLLRFDRVMDEILNKEDEALNKEEE